MKILSVVSSKKCAGKTFFSSRAISSLCYKKYNVAYYKPFQMNIVDNHLPDIDYIKHTTPLLSGDIYSSFGFIGSLSPIFLSERQIDIREIRDFLLDSKDKYDVLLMEGIGIYEPISTGTTFFDIISNTFSIQNDIIMISQLDENVVDSTLSMVEAIYARSKSIKMVIINQSQYSTYDLNVLKEIILYIKKLLQPIPVFFMPYVENQDSILYNKKAMIHKRFEKIADYIFSIL